MNTGLTAIYLHDAKTDTYTGYFPNHPGIIVQSNDVQELREKLVKAFSVFLKYWSRQSEGGINLTEKTMA
jgi:predicted RNase H-like HicB family nuclease